MNRPSPAVILRSLLPPRAGLPFNTDEDQLLVACCALKRTVSQISALIERTPFEVAERLELLGLQSAVVPPVQTPDDIAGRLVRSYGLAVAIFRCCRMVDANLAPDVLATYQQALHLLRDRAAQERT